MNSFLEVGSDCDFIILSEIDSVVDVFFSSVGGIWARVGMGDSGLAVILVIAFISGDVCCLGNAKQHDHHDESVFPARALVDSPVLATVIAFLRVHAVIKQTTTPHRKPIHGAQMAATVDMGLYKKCLPTGRARPPTTTPSTVNTQVKYLPSHYV